MSAGSEDSLKPTKWTSSDPWNRVAETPGGFPSTPRSEYLTAAEYYGTVGEVVRARHNEYLVKRKITVKVGTWNTASMHGTEKDLGAWFAEGLGVRGLTQNLSGLDIDDDGSDDSEIESINEQEAHFKRKHTSIPKHDKPAVSSGNEVDLYVLGLQEVVDIASMSEALKPYTDPNPGKKWKKALRRALPRGYKKVVEQQLLGLLLLVYASPVLLPEVTSVSCTHIGTGALGYLGNKGAVSARIVLGHSTRLLFVNCHLAAGADETALTRRIWDTNQILTRTKFDPVDENCVTGQQRSEQIGDEDFAFWFGDLNYRLDDIPGEDVRRLLLLHTRNEYDVMNKSKRRIDSELGFTSAPTDDNVVTAPYEEPDFDRPANLSHAEPSLDPQHDPASLITTLKSLLQHDQLQAQQKAQKVFHEGWKEGEIDFLPTYKYDVGSVAMFDSGEKKRSPSWCDRILFRSKKDYLEYLKKAATMSSAEARDQEMIQRGIEAEATEESVLFDYDPENDGDNSDATAEDHTPAQAGERESNQEDNNDDLQINEYVSHQRILSSDHKPLSAVFSLVYRAVDPDLKTKVQQEVVKQFDKAENEARPNVTLVLDHAPRSHVNADKSPELNNSNLLDFNQIAYNISYLRSFTLANTGPTQVFFAFIDQPARGEGQLSASDWLSITVNGDSSREDKTLPGLNAATKYSMLPGDTTTIEIKIHVHAAELVRRLNDGAILEDTLILRISGGRDMFIPVRATWLPTCYFRSIDELVRMPSGVRSLLSSDRRTIQPQLSSTTYHSAPPELFALTNIIPDLITRVIADWSMLHDPGEAAPWATNPSWPFKAATPNFQGEQVHESLLADIREALDTQSSLNTCTSEAVTPAEKLNAMTVTLPTFLESLTDGIITAAAWTSIENQLAAFERAKDALTSTALQELVYEALSISPVHSVSLTFIIFMLIRTNAILSSEDDAVQNQAASQRGRSESVMSDISLASITSTKSKSSFFSTFSRRGAGRSTDRGSSDAAAAVAHGVDVSTSVDARIHAFAEIFGPLVIRSRPDPKLKAKERIKQEAKKVKVFEALLIQSS